MILALCCTAVTSICIGFPQVVSASFLDDLLGSGYKTYENSTYTVKVDYPKDWKFENQEIDQDTQPETIFSVIFHSPFESGGIDASVSIYLDKVKESTTLEEYKNRIMKNLREAGEDVKDISLSTSILDGNPAYRIEDTMWLLDHWEKDISIYSVKNGKVYEISALGKPEGMERYSEEIENMFKSVKFH
jgi:hypothetical protein